MYVTYMTICYVVHGSFSVLYQTNLTEYENTIYNLCNAYNGNDIYLHYENMNDFNTSSLSYRKYQKSKPNVRGTVEVKFNVFTTPNESVLEETHFDHMTDVKGNPEGNPEVNESDETSEISPMYETMGVTNIEGLCKFMKLLQGQKVDVDIIYDESSMRVIYQSLQMEKMSEIPKAKVKPKTKTKPIPKIKSKSNSNSKSVQTSKVIPMTNEVTEVNNDHGVHNTEPNTEPNTEHSANNQNHKHTHKQTHKYNRHRSLTETDIMIIDTLNKKKKSSGVPSFDEFMKF